ncbi:MAG: hypothetical protein WBW80_08540, partial [Acidimicrobiales bacterium]
MTATDPRPQETAPPPVDPRTRAMLTELTAIGTATPSADMRPGKRSSPTLRRRLLGTVIHAGWAWIARNGAVGPGDGRARQFGSFGTGSCLAFP